MSNSVVKSRWASRSEGVTLRPYADLGPLEAHLHEALHLEIKSNQGEEHISNKQVYELSPKDVVNLGLSVHFGSPDILRALVNPLVLSLDDVDLYVVATDRKVGVLKDQVCVFKAPLNDLKSTYTIAESGAESVHRLFGNQKTGFIVEVALVHNKNIDGDFSIRPRKKGALIAKVVFEVRPVGVGDSLQPRELTDQVREMYGLSKEAWTLIEAKPGLLTAEVFDDALTFYVDRRILDILKVAQEPAKTLVETGLLANAMSGFVHGVSQALHNSPGVNEEELSASQVMRFLRAELKPKSDEELIENLKEQPHVLVSKLLSNQKTSKKLFSELNKLQEAQGDLSDFED